MGCPQAEARRLLGRHAPALRRRGGAARQSHADDRRRADGRPRSGERVRFLDLLSELGENSVVILSTHIVEDVSELCTRMAIIDKGEILLEAVPLRAVEELRGRIWRRVIAKEALPAVERDHHVVSTKLLAGRTVVHVYSDTRPGPGFEPNEPDSKTCNSRRCPGFSSPPRARRRGRDEREVPRDIPASSWSTRRAGSRPGSSSSRSSRLAS